MVKKIHIVRKSRRRSRRRSPRKSKKNKKSNRRSRRKSNTKKLKGGGGPDWTRQRIERDAAARGEPGPATEGRLVNVEEWSLKEYLIPYVGGKPKFLRDKSFNITPEKEEIILDLLKKV